MTARNVIPILFILLGTAVAGLGLTGIIWLVTARLLGHGFSAIVVCVAFIALGMRAILEGMRRRQSAL